MNERPLTPAERATLSPGLETALAFAGAEPRIVAAAHPGARISAAWRGQVPILTRGDRVFWPRAPADLSRMAAMATLQHELQHVLDYATGWLTARRYLCDPRHWFYAIPPGWSGDFAALGAEQRAVLAERLWLAEAGLRPRAEIARLRVVIPWAAGAHGTPSLGRGDRSPTPTQLPLARADAPPEAEETPCRPTSRSSRD